LNRGRSLLSPFPNDKLHPLQAVKTEKLMIEMSNKNGQWFQNTEAYVGMKYFNINGELVWEQEMNDFNQR
jgi:hypothetical protein